ncbi:hypothetical protein I3760_01G192200 [Carya illinoinensis]|nr:hypothetical protein I3760_13G097000 [Carya illinoinensis]KAG2718572.1 hypothetical protein I3760_03G226500 [Carya illinoinensis]KAG2728167.1 hypothetical protein I3760_01G192200 [Carya illinoinensis]
MPVCKLVDLLILTHPLSWQFWELAACHKDVHVSFFMERDTTLASIPVSPFTDLEPLAESAPCTSRFTSR